MTYFLYVATIVFSVWGVWWSKRDFKNVVIKLSFFALAAWGTLLSLAQLGYIVKR